MMKNILVALDNSEFADKVMKQAVDLAKVLGANLTAVSVLDYSVMTYIDEAGVVIMPEVLEGMKKSFELVLNRCRELADNAGLFYKQEILRGSPGTPSSSTRARMGSTLSSWAISGGRQHCSCYLAALPIRWPTTRSARCL